MFEHIHRLARRLLPIRPLLVGLAACGLLTAGVGLFVFSGTQGNHILMPAIILMLWAVTGLIFIDVFAELPRQPHASGDDWRGRWSARLRQGLHWVFVLGFLALSLTVVDLSLHIVNTWLADGSR